MIIDEEILSAQGLRLAIVVSRFNRHITDALLQDALATIEKLDGEKPTVVFVPGAFEIPVAAHQLAQTGKYDAVICLGCVIRGGTPHFEYVCQGATQGVQQAMLATGVPMAFGVLTTDTLEQAAERSSGRAGSKGAEATLAAIEMVQVLRKVRHG